MRRTDIIVVVSIFGSVLVIAGLRLSGHEDWAGHVLRGLLLLALALVVFQVLVGRKGSISRPAADSGSVVNDLYLGTTYSGPRQVAPPLGKQTELVVDDGERREFLKTLDAADARSDRGRSEKRPGP